MADTPEQPVETDAIAEVLSDGEATPDVETPEVSQETETQEEPQQGDTADDDSNESSEVPAEEESEAEGEAEPQDNQVDPKEEARMRYEERQRLNAQRRAQIEAQTQDYVQQGEDEYDQRIRNMEVQQYVANIERNEEKLVTEFERVKANPDLQIFNPESENFNAKAYNTVLENFNAANVTYDTNGSIIEVKGSLYNHLNKMADLLKESANTGAVQQVKAARKMRASADTKPAAPPKESAKDPILDALSSED
jgi:hypothetical protein